MWRECQQRKKGELSTDEFKSLGQKKGRKEAREEGRIYIFGLL